MIFADHIDGNPSFQYITMEDTFPGFGVKFFYVWSNDSKCSIFDKKERQIAEATKLGKLYYLEGIRRKVNAIQGSERRSKENL